MKNAQRIILSGRAGLIGNPNVILRPYMDLNPGDKVFSIGEASKAGKITSSRRIDFFHEHPVEFAGWFQTDFFPGHSILFKIPWEWCRNPPTYTKEHIFGVYHPYSPGELMMQHIKNNGPWLYRAKFNLYDVNHQITKKYGNHSI